MALVREQPQLFLFGAQLHYWIVPSGCGGDGFNWILEGEGSVQCIELHDDLAGLLGCWVGAGRGRGKARRAIDWRELAAAAQLHTTTTPGQLRLHSGEHTAWIEAIDPKHEQQQQQQQHEEDEEGEGEGGKGRGRGVRIH
ncbi:hypothetical protein N431DRAFT_447056 [Stipitochalara longipes BDJ]|nr:hypothetical protein N431DRAFT_447056 [Stipitochalara longipes BDJ]